MVSYVRRVFPQTLLVVVGFSLGGNVVCKFLGEKTANQERVLCCVSVCQGYSALRWENEGRTAAPEKSQSQENKCVCVCAGPRRPSSSGTSAGGSTTLCWPTT